MISKAGNDFYYDHEFLSDKNFVSLYERFIDESHYRAGASAEFNLFVN